MAQEFPITSEQYADSLLSGSMIVGSMELTDPRAASLFAGEDVILVPAGTGTRILVTVAEDAFPSAPSKDWHKTGTISDSWRVCFRRCPNADRATDGTCTVFGRGAFGMLLKVAPNTGLGVGIDCGFLRRAPSPGGRLRAFLGTAHREGPVWGRVLGGFRLPDGGHLALCAASGDAHPYEFRVHVTPTDLRAMMASIRRHDGFLTSAVVLEQEVARISLICHGMSTGGRSLVLTPGTKDHSFVESASLDALDLLAVLEPPVRPELRLVIGGQTTDPLTPQSAIEKVLEHSRSLTW